MPKAWEGILAALASGLSVLFAADRAPAAFLTGGSAQKRTGEFEVTTGLLNRADPLSHSTGTTPSTIHVASFTPHAGPGGATASGPTSPAASGPDLHASAGAHSSALGRSAEFEIACSTPGPSDRVGVPVNAPRDGASAVRGPSIAGVLVSISGATGVRSGLGPLAVGTFPADAAGGLSLAVVSGPSSSEEAVLKAVEVRKIIASAVPEPSSLTLCGLAVLIGSAHAWRRREVGRSV